MLNVVVAFMSGAWSMTLAKVGMKKKKHDNLRNECVFMEKFCHSVYLKLLDLCVILQNCSAITCFYILW